MNKLKISILKISAAALFLAAAFALTLTSVHADTAEYIKIGLKYGAGAPSSITVSASEGLSLYTAGDSGIVKAGSVLDGYTSVVLKNNSSSVLVTDASGNTITTLSGSGTECIASSTLLSSGAAVAAGGTSYRGGIIPYLNSSKQMNIINYADIEEYLRSVVSVEMSPSYELEALKAQAVAARSFVKANQTTHASQGFSVCSTTHCQVYGGVSKESARTDQAVSETSGKLMYYDGAAVAGYYMASSGGHTENSEDVWTAALGYLRGKSDPYSSDSSWTVTITKAQLNKIFSSRGLGDIKSVTIDSTNDSGYAASVTVTGSRSSYTVKKDSIRSMFSGYSLKSRNFTFDTSGGTKASSGGSSVTVPESGSWYAVGSSGSVKLGQSINVATSSGTYSSQLDGSYVIDENGKISGISYTPAQTTSSGGSVTVTFNSDSDTLIINGKGNGHGVGMSQTGAQEMAKQGFDYAQILKFYYTDIEVK